MPLKLPSHGLERRPWRALAQGVDEMVGPLSAIRELVAGIPPPRRDHRENQGAALAQQRLINVRIVLRDRLRHVRQNELDRPDTTGLKIDE